MQPHGAVLLERAAELAAVSQFAVETSSGTGRLVLVEGAAGFGKTSLLNHLVRQFPEHGMRVLTARAAEQERTHAFGVVRQLFERLVADRPLPSGAGAVVATLFASDAARGELRPGQLLHGLYWALADLCQDGPVALVVDDAHEADDASLGFVAYLARRQADLPVLTLLGARPAVPDAWARRELATLRA